MPSPDLCPFPKRVVLVSGYKRAQTWDVTDTKGFSSFFFRKKRADPVSLSTLLACLSALLCGKKHVWFFHKFLVPR